MLWTRGGLDDGVRTPHRRSTRIAGNSVSVGISDSRSFVKKIPQRRPECLRASAPPRIHALLCCTQFSEHYRPIVSTSPDILKYFHEEPALLEPVSRDRNPDARRRTERSDLPNDPSVPLEELLDTRDAYRGYLAGTNRADDRVGLTTLRTADAYVAPLIEALGRAWWGRCTADGRVEPIDADAARRVLGAPSNTSVLVTAADAVADDAIAAVAGEARRRALRALRTLLDTAHVVFFPEPAHDGHDWSCFSATPMRDRVVEAFRAHSTETTRRFVLPYQRARSESKFYFESWQLTEGSLPDYIEEV